MYLDRLDDLGAGREETEEKRARCIYKNLCLCGLGATDSGLGAMESSLGVEALASLKQRHFWESVTPHSVFKQHS